MAPQPLSRVRKNAILRFDPLALSQRQEHAYTIAGIINAWAYLESALGGMMADMFSPENKLAAAVYSSLQNSAAERRVLEAVLKQRLKSRDFLLFQAIYTVVNPLLKSRNNFAHRLVGITDELPEAVLVVHTDEVWKARAATLEDTLKRLLAAGVELGEAVPTDIDRSQVFVYTVLDLRDVVNKMLYAVELIDRFRRIVLPIRFGSADTPESRNQQYHLLCTEPQIQAALLRRQQKHP